MGTVAIDPFAPEFDKSDLPPGGNPRDDAAYLDWANYFCARVNARWLDVHSGWGRELPRKGELVNRWQLTEHLYKTLIGWKFPDGTGPSRAHRIRFVAVQYKLRPMEVRSEARRYVVGRKDELTRGLPS